MDRAAGPSSSPTSRAGAALSATTEIPIGSGRNSPLEKPKSKFHKFKDRLLSPHLKEYRPQAAAVAAAVAAVVDEHAASKSEVNTCCHLSLTRSDGSSSTDSQQSGDCSGRPSEGEENFSSRRRPSVVRRDSEIKTHTTDVQSSSAMVTKDSCGDGGALIVDRRPSVELVAVAAASSALVEGSRSGSGGAKTRKGDSDTGSGAPGRSGIPLSRSSLVETGANSPAAGTRGGGATVACNRSVTSIGLSGSTRTKTKRTVTLAQPTTTAVVHLDGISSADDVTVSTDVSSPVRDGEDDDEEVDDTLNGSVVVVVGQPGISSRSAILRPRFSPTSRTSKSPDDLERVKRLKPTEVDDEMQYRVGEIDDLRLSPSNLVGGRTTRSTSGTRGVNVASNRLELPVVFESVRHPPTSFVVEDAAEAQLSSTLTEHNRIVITGGKQQQQVQRQSRVNCDGEEKIRRAAMKTDANKQIGNVIRPQRQLPDTTCTPDERSSSDAQLTDGSRSAAGWQCDNRIAALKQQARDDDDGLHEERTARISFRGSADQVPLPFSFRRGDRLRSSLPVVGATNKSMEQPLGIVFLVFRNRTESGLLPNEITSINTVWALFVRAFPNSLSMLWFESAIWTIWILDTRACVYRILQDIRLISDHSVLRLEESETCLSVEVSQSLPSYSIVSPAHGDHQLAPLCGKRSNSARRQSSTRKMTSQMGGHQQTHQLQSPEDCLTDTSLISASINDDCADTITTAAGLTLESVHHSRDRLSEMENRMDSLAALVHSAILRPDSAATGSIDSLTSTASQVTVQKAPLGVRPQTQSSTSIASQRASSEQFDGDDGQGRLRRVAYEARTLRNDIDQLRQIHLTHVVAINELLHETFVKLMKKMTSMSVTMATPTVHKTVRQQVTEVQSGYCIDAAKIDGQLKNLESCVESLRNDVVAGRSRVVLTDVEAMILALGHIGRSLSHLKGRLHTLEERMKPVMASEIEIVVQEERFIKEEPHRLDKSVVRCKHLGGTLLTLKKLAMVQDSGVTQRSNNESSQAGIQSDVVRAASAPCQRSTVGSPRQDHQQAPSAAVDVEKRQSVQLIRRPPSSTSGVSSPTVGSRLFVTPSPISGSNGGGRVAAVPPANGLCSSPPIPPPRNNFVAPSSDSEVSSSAVAQAVDEQLTPSPLATTPPTRPIEVWQRHGSRSGSARYQYHLQQQRGSAPHPTPLASPVLLPKSCPSSPAFDGTQRRASGSGEGRRATVTGSRGDVSSGGSRPRSGASQLPSYATATSTMQDPVTPPSPTSSSSSSSSVCRGTAGGGIRTGKTSPYRAVPVLSANDSTDVDVGRSSSGKPSKIVTLPAVAMARASCLRRPAPGDLEMATGLSTAGAIERVSQAAVDRRPISSGLRSPTSGRYAYGDQVMMGASGKAHHLQHQQQTKVGTTKDVHR